MRHDFLPLPVGRNFHRPTVASHMVSFDRHFGRIIPEAVAPRITYIDILRIAISVQLPQTRHRHRGPAAVIEIGTEEIGRPLVGIFNPIEFPWAVECHEIG